MSVQTAAPRPNHRRASRLAIAVIAGFLAIPAAPVGAAGGDASAAGPSSTDFRGRTTGHTANATPAAATATCATRQAAPFRLCFTTVASGYSAPVLVTSARGVSRLFVVEQAGRIRIVGRSPAYLNIEDRVAYAGERGLLSLAFHPKFATNFKFYVYYTANNGDIAVEEYRASSASAYTVSTATRRRVLTIPHPRSNHNGGTLAFGRDGYLYISTGDGGGAEDPDEAGQRLDTLLGKMLRINVDSRTHGAYGIPTSNPFYDRTGAKKEIWARGLRNPFRFSFDRANGNLWIGDVGQYEWEEVNRSPADANFRNAGRGANYGWDQWEGNHCFESCTTRSGMTFPVTEYSHTYGQAVTGGFVYRGSSQSLMAGRYFFADHYTGRIWTYRGGEGRKLAADTGYLVSSFGEGRYGELYLSDYNGRVLRVTATQ